MPKQLFPAPLTPWDVTDDDQKISEFAVSPLSRRETTQTPITVVVDWTADLRSSTP